jgi:hypothetical protein
MSARQQAPTLAPPPPPAGAVPTFHVAVRLDGPTLARVDALIPSLSSAWRRANRSDAMGALVAEALPILEKRAAKGGAA